LFQKAVIPACYLSGYFCKTSRAAVAEKRKLGLTLMNFRLWPV